MEIKINRDKWEVKFVNISDKDLLTSEGIKCFGITDYINQTILIAKDTTESKIIDTIIHAFIFSYGFHLENCKDEEPVCNFFDLKEEEIKDISHFIFEELKKVGC